jgi:hypothetical protein
MLISCFWDWKDAVEMGQQNLVWDEAIIETDAGYCMGCLDKILLVVVLG